MPQPREIVGLFGLPTQKGMEDVMKKRMSGATDDLKDHITKQLKTPLILVSVASVVLIAYLIMKKK